MRAVNLLPKEAARRHFRAPFGSVALVAIVGAAAVVVALAFAFLQAQNAVDEKRSELESAKLELAVTPRPEPAAKPAGNELADERAKRASAFASAFSSRVAWDRVLRRFSLVLPNDVWLATLSATAPGSASTATTSTSPSGSSSSATTSSDAEAAGAPTGFTVTGYAYSHAGVARLLSRLDVLPDLTNVQLQTSAVTQLGESEVVQFTVLADVRAEGES
jgi:Tfp pilus assembly protein PilN